LELEKVNNDYSKILTNWTKYMNRTQKKGFEKQKRGPKLKQLKFRTAKELKSMVFLINLQFIGAKIFS
jgi:hypothetical protein